MCTESEVKQDFMFPSSAEVFFTGCVKENYPMESAVRLARPWFSFMEA